MDVSAPDNLTIEYNGGLPIQLGGKFTCPLGTLVIPTETVLGYDGTILRVRVPPASPALVTSIGKVWFEVMVMRTTAALQVYRSMTPHPRASKYRKI